MANEVDTLLEQLNAQVAKLSTSSLPKMTAVLDAAEAELTHDLAKWAALGKGAERFTPQMYRNALLQIRKTLEHIRGPMGEAVASALRHGGVLAAGLATSHLIKEVETFSKHFEGSVRPIALDTASVLAEGKQTVWPKFSNSAKRYAGQVGEDIQKQLAIGVVRGETIDQLTTRLAKLGGPKGLVYTRGQAGSPGAKAEYIAEGLFRRYKHFGERLARTEVVNAYNTFAMEGMDELEEMDPGYFQQWNAALDRRTCEFCARYDGLTAKLDAAFPGGVKQPPLHPNCRCCLVAWRKEWTESRHRKSLDSELVPGKEPQKERKVPSKRNYPEKSSLKKKT